MDKTDADLKKGLAAWLGEHPEISLMKFAAKMDYSCGNKRIVSGIPVACLSNIQM